MTIEDTLKQLARVSKQLQEARKEQIEAMSEHLKEAEKKLKEAREAREASEVKLSDLDPEEWEDCKGMWVLGEYYNGEIFEGIIFSFYRDDVLVRIPKSGSHQWRRADQLILLPDYQRAFGPDGGPVKVDHGQWEKTHAMEDEFDRIKAEEAHAHLRLFHAVTDYAEDSGMVIVGAKFAGGGNAELRFEQKEVK